MAVCKECGALNPDSNKFCSECGQLIVKLDSKAIRDAVSQLEAEFEQDALVNLDRSRLTYICDVCGKVNPIDAKLCLRCGKKRPRSEYITALTKIKTSKNLKTAVETMSQIDEKPVVKPATIVGEQPPRKEEFAAAPPPAPILPKEEQSSAFGSQEQMQLYRFNQFPEGTQQTRQIVQPFVIVPYVSQNQPLIQYNPNQIYRYEPLTASEKQLKSQREEQMKADQAAREAEAQKTLQQRKKMQVEATLSQKKRDSKRNDKVRKASSSKVHFAAFLAFLVAIAGIVAAFIDLVIKDFVVFQYLRDKTVVDIAKDIFSPPSFGTQVEILSFAFGLLILLFLVTLALIAVQCLVRLFTGRVRRRGFVNMLLPVLALIFAAGIAVTKAAVNDFAAGAMFGDVYGWIVAAGAAVIVFVLYLIMGSRKKRKQVSQVNGNKK